MFTFLQHTQRNLTKTKLSKFMMWAMKMLTYWIGIFEQDGDRETVVRLLKIKQAFLENYRDKDG